MTANVCHYCGTGNADMRPYGPGGSWVCFPCATATPERDTETGSAFGAILEATSAISPTGVVAIGDKEGPRPFDPQEAS